jgi:hypothetical protein
MYLISANRSHRALKLPQKEPAIQPCCSLLSPAPEVLIFSPVILATAAFELPPSAIGRAVKL